MSRVFLAYSRDDTDLMRRLRASLLEAGFQVSTDESEFEPGTSEWEAEVDDAFQQTEALVLLLSPAARDSVRLDLLLDKAHTHTVGVFPAKLSGEPEMELPPLLPRVDHFDLTQDYQAGLQELVRALAGHFGLPLPRRAVARPDRAGAAAPVRERGLAFALGVIGASIVLLGIGVGSVLLLVGAIDLPSGGIAARSAPVGTATIGPTPLQPFTPTVEVGTPTPQVPTAIPTSFDVCPSGCSYDDLAQAIADAPSGTTIQLREGTLGANVMIDKNLMLVGAGRDETNVEALGSQPVFFITGDEGVEVSIQSLTISGGNASEGPVGCIASPEDCQSGVVVRGSAFASLNDVNIVDHDDSGLWTSDTADVIVTNSDIADNHVSGVSLAGQSVVALGNVNLLDNGGQFDISAGIRADDFSQLDLSGVTLSGNTWTGVWALESARVDIRDSIIVNGSGGFGAFGAGLSASGVSQVTVHNSTIEGNGTHAGCLEAETGSQVCSGVLALGETNVSIIDSIIRGNADWGVASHMVECGYETNQFNGIVAFLGSTTVEGNNLAGSLAELGNPGSHPWSDTEPGGQVCLPFAESTVGAFCGDGVCQEFDNERCNQCVSDCGYCPPRESVRVPRHKCEYQGGDVFRWFSARLTYEYGVLIEEEIMGGPYRGPWGPGCPAPTLE